MSGRERKAGYLPGAARPVLGFTCPASWALVSSGRPRTSGPRGQVPCAVLGLVWGPHHLETEGLDTAKPGGSHTCLWLLAIKSYKIDWGAQGGDLGIASSGGVRRSLSMPPQNPSSDRFLSGRELLEVVRWFPAAARAPRVPAAPPAPSQVSGARALHQTARGQARPTRRPGLCSPLGTAHRGAVKVCPARLLGCA
jgi:hypothetical protein